MSNRTKIAWADATWNPFSGCTPISEGCEHCYAKRMAGRNLPHLTHGHGFEPTFHPQRLSIPTHWRKPRRVFVCSMSDMFHEAFTDEQIFQALNACIKNNRRHTYMVLTKRPERMRQWFADNSPRFWHYHAEGEPKRPYVIPDWPDPQLWLGVTAENQARADERIPEILRTPAAVKFVSLEPLLGPIDLGEYTDYTQDDEEAIWRAAEAEPVTLADRKRLFPKLDWVIVGGETGPGARPMQPEWALDVWRQCKAAGVPFFFKQPGSWLAREMNNGRYRPTDEYREMESTQEFPKGEQ